MRLASPGYQEVHRTGQWLPGDSESVEWVLTRDRMATLGEILAASPGAEGSGPVLSEMAAASGASRVALLVLAGGGDDPDVRVFAWKAGDPAPAQLGRFAWPGGDEASGEAARLAARMLRDAGWPAAEGAEARDRGPWYSRWWFWTLLGIVAAGVAAGLAGGGGGSSGSSTGSIGVTF